MLVFSNKISAYNQYNKIIDALGHPHVKNL